MSKTEKEKAGQFRIIIKLANKVYSTLGWGFKEEVYQDALEKEFIANKIPYIREKHLSVYYDLGKEDFAELQHTFRADFYCYNEIIVEIKSLYLEKSRKTSVDKQIKNYMAATKSKFAILLNFYGNRDEIYYTVYPHELFFDINAGMEDYDGGKNEYNDERVI